MPKTEKPKGKILLRQRVLEKQLSGNLWKSRKQAMIDSGYSESYADSSQITKTISWQELMDKNLPDKMLLREHRKLFHAEGLQRFIFPSSMTDEEMKETIKKIRNAKVVAIQRGRVWARVFFTYPDYKIKKEGVELGYKTKGRLTEKHKIEGEIKTINIINYADTTKTSG